MRSSILFPSVFILLSLSMSVSFADEIKYEVSGVQDPILTNVVNHVTGFRLGSGAKLNSRLRRKLIEDTENSSKNALRPYGYFNPAVTVELKAHEAGKWLVKVDIKPGSPVRIMELEIGVTGSGKELPEIKLWKKEFPLKEGRVLKQPYWDKAKLDAIDKLEANGYLNATFSRHEIRVDPVANTARLKLLLDTGPQAVIGAVTFKQDILNNAVLASLQRFNTGDAYNSWLLGKFRLDLWRSGYFEDIRIVQRRDLLADPPRVDLEVNFNPRKKNSYQGTIGFGTDTLARIQFRWARHLLSPRGDNFDLGFGWQQKNNEFSLQGNYRLPRETRTQQYWIAQFGIKSENQSLSVSSENDPDVSFDIARGSFDDYFLRLGKTRVRNLKGGYEQLFETIYVQYLREDQDFQLIGNIESLTGGLQLSDPIDQLLGTKRNSLIVGMDWDWPEIRGTGFETTGHHERAWIFTSNDTWGSDANFSQIYLSSRFNKRLGNRWKLLLRAEAGYSKARTQDFEIPSELGNLGLSVTELPYLYRFKAGGSRSVRGYAFESLDNNSLGSNNILSASAEVEYLFRDDWSLAAFADAGNAFNDWSKPALKIGSGIGLRWYSVIGALRLDVAKGWDLKGQPWRIHLTIGTPLL